MTTDFKSKIYNHITMRQSVNHQTQLPVFYYSMNALTDAFIYQRKLLLGWEQFT